jgi:hypothetical protein
VDLLWETTAAGARVEVELSTGETHRTHAEEDILIPLSHPLLHRRDQPGA